MADVKDLFKGIALVIDDNVKSPESNDSIVKIIQELENHHIPILKYEDVPKEEEIPHLHSISFIILDWDIKRKGLSPFVKSDNIEEDTKENIINFLSIIKEICYAPIFIFTNNGKGEIESEIIKAVDKKLPVLFKTKSELFNEKHDVILWEVLQNWLDHSSGIYVQKIWDYNFKNARIDFMGHLNSNCHWPNIIIKTAFEDGVDITNEINEIIFHNLKSRMSPLDFELEQVEKDKSIPSREEVISILESQRFIPNSSLKDGFSTGDFYKKNDNFYINIRPACDCINRKGFDNKLYLLRCYEIEDPHNNYENGTPKEKSNETIIGPLFDGKFFSIKFKYLTCDKATKYKDRLGRITPPFITSVVQKYGLYIQRQGLPRMPIHALYTPEEIERIAQEDQNKEKDDQKID